MSFGLQVDCLWNLIQLGQENYAQQANINIVLQERQTLKIKYFGDYENMNMSLCLQYLEMLKGKLNLIYLDGNCDEMLEGILSLLLDRLSIYGQNLNLWMRILWS